MGKCEKVFQLSTVFSVVFTLLISAFHVNSLTLDSDGYYDIVVAINEKTAQNEIDYINNLKVSIQDLSSAIWESTHNKLSIRSVDIILPNHWTHDADGFVTTQTYQNADIRISHEYLVPQAINPTFCGYPGRYIELPYSFFDERDVGPYGPTGKALLTMWARYRWGIFEEHGFPGDSKFPYFWKAWTDWEKPIEERMANADDPWKVTSCSDTEIKGTYKTITGEECGPDYEPPEVTENPDLSTVQPQDPNDEYYPPPSNCRFHPDIYNQTASSSLMSFSFIQSLLDFCDERTHNARAPNRQNFFCQFKSAWEVMRESLDWKQLNEGSTNLLAPIKYRILKKTEKPLLFILSEGVNMPPDEVISTMSSRLEEMFDNSEHWNVLASAGVFPGQDMKNSFDTVYAWNQPWFSKQELITAFRESFGSRESTKFRNFGAAIQDIGTLMRERKHSPGGVVIMLKYGSEADAMLQNQWPAYEADVIATILDQNIRLFVLEGEDQLADGDPSAPYRLKNIAELTGGSHFKIDSSSETSEEENVKSVNAVMANVDNILTSGRVPRSRYRLVYKGAEPTIPTDMFDISFLVNYRDVVGLNFYMHTGSNDMDLYDIRFTETPVTNPPNFNEYYMWNRGINEMYYKSYFAQWTNSTDDGPLTEPSEWKLSFYCYYCKYMFVAIAEVASGETLNEDELNDENITIELYTSAEEDGNVADLSVENVASLKGVAFTIYAKLEKNGHPITSVEVTAHVCYYQDGQTADPNDPQYYLVSAVDCKAVQLKDGGPWIGDPDITANDGIFSGNYIPDLSNFWNYEHDKRGTYQILATGKLLSKGSAGNRRSSPLPIDQENIRCGSGYQGCWIETVTQPFFVYADLKQRIDIIGVLKYTNEDLGAATRIMDLRISPSPVTPGGGSYVIEWTNPTVLSGTRPGPAIEFQLYFANSFDDILTENFSEENRVVGLPNPGPAGETSNITVTDLADGEKRWYVIRSIATTMPNVPKPVWSNVIFVQATSAYFATTTTTTTTTTPAPTPSTTRLSTSETPPSTIPTTPKTTEPSTLTSRTTRRLTSRVPITFSTTTQRPTTVSIEITTQKNKYWYESTEAIATFSVFGVLIVAILAGVVAYTKIMHRD